MKRLILWGTENAYSIALLWKRILEALFLRVMLPAQLSDITAWANFFVTWKPDHIYDPNGNDRTQPDSPPDRWQACTVELIRLIRAFRQRSSGISLSLCVGSSASCNPPELSTFTSWAFSASLHGSACLTDLSHDSALSKCSCRLFYCSVGPDLLLVEGMLWLQNKLDSNSFCDTLLIVTDNNYDSSLSDKNALTMVVFVECACIFVATPILIPHYEAVWIILWAVRLP